LTPEPVPVRPVRVVKETPLSFLAKSVHFLKRYIRFAFAFRLDLAMTLLGLLATTTMWAVMAGLVGPAAAPRLSAHGYGDDYFSFLLLGLMVNSYLWIPLRKLYSALQSQWGSGWLDFMLLTPSSPLSHLFGPQSYDFFMATVQVSFQLTVGYIFFGFEASPTANIPGALLVLILGLLSMVGWGLLAASTFTLLNAKGGGNPVAWFLTTFTPLLAGVYYPPELLPGWLRTVSYLLPHTHAMKGIRKALLEGATIKTLLPSITALITLGAIIVPLGYLAFKHSIKKGKKDGSILPW